MVILSLPHHCTFNIWEQIKGPIPRSKTRKALFSSRPDLGDRILNIGPAVTGRKPIETWDGDEHMLHVDYVKDENLYGERPNCPKDPNLPRQ